MGEMRIRLTLLATCDGDTATVADSVSVTVRLKGAWVAADVGAGVGVVDEMLDVGAVTGPVRLMLPCEAMIKVFCATVRGPESTASAGRELKSAPLGALLLVTPVPATLRLLFSDAPLTSSAAPLATWIAPVPTGVETAVGVGVAPPLGFPICRMPPLTTVPPLKLLLELVRLTTPGPRFSKLFVSP